MTRPWPAQRCACPGSTQTAQTLHHGSVSRLTSIAGWTHMMHTILTEIWQRCGTLAALNKFEAEKVQLQLRLLSQVFFTDWSIQAGFAVCKQWSFLHNCFISAWRHIVGWASLHTHQPAVPVCCTWEVVVVDRNESTTWYTCPGSFPDDTHICLTTNLQQSNEVSHLRETTTMTSL